MIESKDGVLWRSALTAAAPGQWSATTARYKRAFYFSHVAVDLKNPDRVYAPSFLPQLSKDGGKDVEVFCTERAFGLPRNLDRPQRPEAHHRGRRRGLRADARRRSRTGFFSAQRADRASLSRRPRLPTIRTRSAPAFRTTTTGAGRPTLLGDPSGIQNKAWIVTTGGDGTLGIPSRTIRDSIWSSSQDGSISLRQSRHARCSWSAIPYISTGKESFLEVAPAKYRFNWESPLAFAPWRKRGDPLVAYYGGNVVFQTSDRGKHGTGPLSAPI